ncbi:MAG: antitoxin [Eggerthellaceae bacterium]|nr:antitoxin [Eggerthellaceae bacterium]
MPQLSLYISDENLETLRIRSAEEGVSMSKYANSLIAQDASNNGWPAGFWNLYGALDDDSFVIPPDPPATDDAAFEQLFA